MDLAVSTILPSHRCSDVRGRARATASTGSLQADRARVVARSQPQAVDVPDLRSRPLSGVSCG